MSGRRAMKRMRRVFYRTVHMLVPAPIRRAVRSLLPRREPVARHADLAARKAQAAEARREAKAAGAEWKARKQALRDARSPSRTSPTEQQRDAPSP